MQCVINRSIQQSLSIHAAKSLDKVDPAGTRTSKTTAARLLRVGLHIQNNTYTHISKQSNLSPNTYEIKFFFQFRTNSKNICQDIYVKTFFTGPVITGPVLYNKRRFTQTKEHEHTVNQQAGK